MRASTVAVAGGALAASYLGVRTGRADAVDAAVGRVATRSLGPAGDRAVAVATDLGSVYGLAGVGSVLALSGRRRAACDVVVAGAAAWVLAQAAKPLLPRGRPYEASGGHRLVAVPAGTSWPSGHVAVATAGVGALLPSLPPCARMAGAATALGVGWSRLYVGVHHASDVVAGLGLGTLVAAAWRVIGRR